MIRGQYLVIHQQFWETSCATSRHPQTHCVLKPMVKRSPWLFMNSYFLYSIPVSIGFLSHTLRTVFTPFSILLQVSLSVSMLLLPATFSFLIASRYLSVLPLLGLFTRKWAIITVKIEFSPVCEIFIWSACMLEQQKHPSRSLSDSPRQFHRLLTALQPRVERKWKCILESTDNELSARPATVWFPSQTCGKVSPATHKRHEVDLLISSIYA